MGTNSSILLLLVSAAGVGLVTPLQTARSAASKGTREGEVDVLLGGSALGDGTASWHATFRSRFLMERLLRVIILYNSI